MTDNYTHFDPLEFTEVTKIQEMLLEPKDNKPKNDRQAQNGLNTLTLVKIPEDKKPGRKIKAS